MSCQLHALSLPRDLILRLLLTISCLYHQQILELSAWLDGKLRDSGFHHKWFFVLFLYFPAEPKHRAYCRHSTSVYWWRGTSLSLQVFLCEVSVITILSSSSLHCAISMLTVFTYFCCNSYPLLLWSFISTPPPLHFCQDRSCFHLSLWPLAKGLRTGRHSCKYSIMNNTCSINATVFEGICERKKMFSSYLFLLGH